MFVSQDVQMSITMDVGTSSKIGEVSRYTIHADEVADGSVSLFYTY